MAQIVCRFENLNNFLCSLFLIGRILVYAILERSLITRACMAVFGIEPYSYRSAGSMLRILKYPGRILTIIRQILRDYVFVGLAYYPIGLFVAASILFVIIILAAAVKKGMCISCFLVSFVTDLFSYYRFHRGMHFLIVRI